MTREEAIEILISVAVCDRPILSCDFCARYVGMGTDCTYPSDKEIEEAVLLLKGASKDMAISALRQQETVTNRNGLNAPLTLDELRQIDAVPVVRCRECKHLNVVNRKELYAHCPKTNTVFLPFELDTREHFCSLGERKEGADNDT